MGVAFHSFRNKNAAQALKHAPTTPAEIVEAIGHKRCFTVGTYLTVWLAGAAAGGPQSGTVPGRQKRRVRTVSAFTLSVEVQFAEQQTTNLGVRSSNLFGRASFQHYPCESHGIHTASHDETASAYHGRMPF